MDSFFEYFLMGYVVRVYDYFEGYLCRQLDKIQFEYFDVVKVLFYVIIFYYYVVEDFDDESSIEDEFNIIKEYLFVILDDIV